MYAHQTIRRYTSALLDRLNRFKIQKFNSKNELIEKNIPVVFYQREKSEILEHLTDDNLLTNANVLPRAYLILNTLVRSESRMTNRNLKVNVSRHDDTLEYAYNSTPFNFNYDYVVMCRGYSEATQIIENVIPVFNPSLAIDVWDADGLENPTRITIKFLDVSIEAPAYEETSNNILEIRFSFELDGYIYQPIKSTSKIKELLIKYHLNDFNTINTAYDYDVIDSKVDQTSQTILTRESANAELTIKSISGAVEKGYSYLTLNYTAQKGDKLKFKWETIDCDSIIIEQNDDKCKILVKDSLNLKVSITDMFNNEVSIVNCY